MDILPIADYGLLVENRGSNLQIPVSVYLDRRPKEAEGNVSEFNGKVVAIGIDHTGNGYISPPTITIEGGGGNGAIADIISIGSIENINNFIGGNDYIDKPNIIFSGSGLSAEAICEISGFIKSVEIVDCGSYNEAPDLIVEGDGENAKLEAIISGYIYKTKIINPGLFNRDIIPTITIENNIGGASIIPIMSILNEDYWNIKELDIINEGFGFSKAPNLLIEGHIPGFAASGCCFINGGISGVNIINPGKNYTQIPKILIKRKPLPTLPKPSGASIFLYPIVESQTPTPTTTSTPTVTPSNTATPSATVTFTPTLTKSKTPSWTHTPTPTNTISITPTHKALHGPIATFNLPTVTPTPSVTVTKTLTPSPTVTKSFSPTPTVTKTKTQTPTITKTSTSTPTITKTSSPTCTVSATHTVTPSHTTNIFTVSSDAIIIPRMSYGVSKINILDGGRYASQPTVEIIPPTVASYEGYIVDSGNFQSFASQPTLKIIGSTISSPFKETREPKAIASINYSIGKIDILNTGYNYTIAPTINLIGGYNPIKGVRANLTALISDGSVTQINIDNPGQFYQTAPYISINSNDEGYGLEIRLTLSGTLDKVYISDPGLNLTSGTPNVRILFEGGDGPINSQAEVILQSTHSGTPCSFTPEVNYKVLGATITNNGENYSYPPQVIINGEQKDFSQFSISKPAKAQAKIEGICSNIKITDGGDDYNTCNSNKSIGIYLYGQTIHGIQKILINDLMKDSSGEILPYNAYVADNKFITNSYNINYSGSEYYCSTLSGYLFNEKPIIAFDDTTLVFTKTFLESSSIAISTTGIPGYCENSTEDQYITTNKYSSIYDQLYYIDKIIDAYGNINKINSLINIENNYASCTTNYITEYFYDESVSSGTFITYPIDPFFSVSGEIIGLSFPIYDSYYSSYWPSGTRCGFICPSGYSYNNDDHHINMLAFFDVNPVLAIEDELGDTESATLSLNGASKFIRLFDNYSYSYPDVGEYYSLENNQAIADGYSRYIYSDLTISDATGFSSYSTLICKTPGVPTSWNHKPEFLVQINQYGQISNVDVIDGGEGFFPQTNSGDYNLRKFEIYFSGGGGIGGKATYSIDISEDILGSIYTGKGIIETVTITDPGRGYVSAPEAIVIDYNTTWKEYYLNNKIYNKNIKDYSFPIGPLQLIDFYFKNASPYISRFAVPNQSVYNSDKLYAIKYAEGYQTNFTRLDNIGSRHQISTNTIRRKDIKRNDIYTGWLQQQAPWLTYNSNDGYVFYNFYNNGYVDDILYYEDSLNLANNIQTTKLTYVNYPYTSNPNINIHNSQYISDISGATLPTLSSS